MNTSRTIKIMISLASLVLVGFTARTIYTGEEDNFDKKRYLTEEKRALIQPGLHVEVMDVSVGDGGTVTVTYRLTDDRNQPLDADGIQTPGAVSARFLLGYIPTDGTQYVSLVNRTQTSPITGDAAVQPTSDSGGTLAQVDTGVYSYTYSVSLPEDTDPEATHSVGMYITRDLEEFGLEEEVVNEVVHFRPDGGEVTQIRDVVRTETCNNCHDPIALHGGSRREVELCIMCHTTDVVDPDTGNSVDMPEMIHKIHMGENLPSVQAGQPYQIIGFRQSVHDYSHVVYPMDVRNCESCHTDGATEHEAWFTRPDRDSCGSCHDDVNFVTGENHVNLPQISDRFCANCHFPQGELEYDGSIIGSHTVPSKSTQLAGINIQITDVSNAGPGMAPTVHFTMNNNAGETIQPGDLPFFNLVIAGPNEDYSFLASEPGRDAVIDGDGFAYTFNQTLPEDAVGSYTVGAEGFRSATLNAGTVRAFDIRESPVVEVFPFAVTDAEAMPRRQIVSEEKCSNCHDQLSAHGTFRHNTEYCVTCHQPMADDAPFRPDDQFPAQSIDFKYMIHKIHMGEELSRDYTVIGFMGNPANYNEVLYPGNVANCEGCHVNDSYAVPSGGVLETPTPYDFFSPTPPNSTACLSCHDGLGAAAHAFTNISPFDESCGTCHGSGAEFDVARIHAH